MLITKHVNSPNALITADVRWFIGAKLNVCYNCVDRHLPYAKDKPALLWEGDEINQSNATDPLFILYTSGSTGKPKGILHGQGGYLLQATIFCALLFISESDMTCFLKSYKLLY